jgi:predicted RNase H-like HicB family nuclease
MEHHFTAVFRKEGKWWAAYVEELPGANTQGKTIEEARANLKEAIAMVLEHRRELAKEQEMDAETVHREELVITTA